MIEVKIAATLERGGLGALRWVLVDPDELARSAPPAAPQRTAAAAQPFVAPQLGAPVQRAGLGVRLAGAVVLLAALGGAWWVSSALLEARGVTTAATAAR